MDELKWKWAFGPYLDPPEGQKESAIKAGYVKVVSKQSADEAIAELKQKLEDVNEIIKTARQMLEDAKATLYTENERLKEGKNDYKQFYQDTFKELESLKASHYAEMVDAGMRERRLRRALWLARADRAKAMYTYWHVKCIEEHLLYEHKWIVVERLCRSKAEEYK